jgi:hypothetical protein
MAALGKQTEVAETPPRRRRLTITSLDTCSERLLEDPWTPVADGRASRKRTLRLITSNPRSENAQTQPQHVAAVTATSAEDLPKLPTTAAQSTPKRHRTGEDLPQLPNTAAANTPRWHGTAEDLSKLPSTAAPSSRRRSGRTLTIITAR